MIADFMISIIVLLPLLGCSLRCYFSMNVIRLCVKSQDPFKMSFKLKLCSFISLPSLFKKEINALKFFGIE